MSDVNTALIIGSGLIGASLGCALTRRGVRVHLQDASQTNAVVAASRGAGIIDEPEPSEVDLVIVAVPPRAIASVVRQALDEFPRSVVTDVGSVKHRIYEDLVNTGVNLQRYIGGHPMAGSHHTGPLTAGADLFTDRTWVLCPRDDNPSWVIQTLYTCIELVGAWPLEMDSQAHDEAVAHVSHVPQLMSSLTAASLNEVASSELDLAGQGLRDVTRIAASDVSMWSQIVFANQSAIKEHLTRVRDDLDTLISHLDDGSVVEDLMERGNAGVDALPTRAGKSRSELVPVIVEIPDSPGPLAKLIGEITATGVNIEDLAIEHDRVREVGYLWVETDIDQADLVRTRLREQGWSLRS